MNTQPPYYTAIDVAARANVNYARVLAAVHSGDLDASKIGGAYIVQTQDAEIWIEKQRLLADPLAIQKLQEENAALKSELRAARAGRGVAA